jgi:hypothetical protein
MLYSDTLKLSSSNKIENYKKKKNIRNDMGHYI